MRTTEKIEELRRLANRCLPKNPVKRPFDEIVKRFRRQGHGEAMANYLAASSPDTVLALIDRLAELEAENERLSDELQSARRDADRALARG